MKKNMDVLRDRIIFYIVLSKRVRGEVVVGRKERGIVRTGLTPHSALSGLISSTFTPGP